MKTIDQFKPGQEYRPGCRLMGFLVDAEGNRCGVVVKVRTNAMFAPPPFYRDEIRVQSIAEVNLILNEELFTGQSPEAD